MSAADGCCADCRRDMPNYWITDLWRYCPHTHVMSKRRSRADAWTLVPHVTPQMAMTHLNRAIEQMKKFAARSGLDFDLCNDLLEWYRTHDPRAKEKSAP